MSYDLVIFDCDGVLLDSERLAIRFDAEIFAEYGWPISEREVTDRYLGRSYTYMIGELAAQVGGLPDDFDDRYERGLRTLFESSLQPVDGVVSALETLEASKVPMCVASSSSHERLEFSLGLVGLYGRFASNGAVRGDGGGGGVGGGGRGGRRIFSASEVSHGKPAPDLFLHAAASMGYDPSRCAVVEDSEFGVRAALAAGMAAYGYVGAGFIPAERLDGAVLFDDMRDLPRLLGITT